MDLEDAKRALKDGYTAAGIDLAGETDDTLSVRFAGQVTSIQRVEIELFGVNREALVDASVAPVECSYCSPTTREQLIRPVDLVRSRFLAPFGARPFLFRKVGTENPTVQIGSASDQFIDFFRFDKAYLALCTRRARVSTFWRTQGDVTLRDRLYRPATVLVTGLDQPTTAAAVAVSNELINAAIFAMSYLRGIPYRLLEQWPTDQPRPRSRVFSTSERKSGFELELPAVRYNDDLLRFYQLGISTEIPELQYLAFYQVLEYFFVGVSDEALYSTLRARLANPAFSLKPTHLDQIIQDVLGHAKTTDETEMLKLVLEKYLREDEVIAFIGRYEDYLSERWYTKKRERFGVDAEVKAQSGHVIGNVAKIVKIVRNALVHSSDRFERIGRHVPFSASSELVAREVPLVKYLAECVIIASAEPAG